MTYIRYLLLIIIFGINDLSGQSDNILWSGIRLVHPVSDKWGIAIQPFVRFNEDVQSYQNTSIDYSLRYNLTKEWHFQLLGRTWFIPGEPGRQFIWTDVAYKKKWASFPVLWTNRLRWHHALDLHERVDSDFVRFFTQGRMTNPGKFHPIFGLEFWLQTQELHDLTRIRIEPGFRYDFSSRSNLLFIWRRQNFINVENPTGDNLWVVILIFSI